MVSHSRTRSVCNAALSRRSSSCPPRSEPTILFNVLRELIPPGIAVLCTPFNPTNTFPLNFPQQYDCGPIVENLDGTNLQAGENSTCYYRRSNGTLLKYTC